MTEEQEIRVGQIWVRKSDGADVRVELVAENFVRVFDGSALRSPWVTTFRKKYEYARERY